MRAGVAKGENPSEAKRRAKREAPGRTFEALANRYLTEYARRRKKSADQDERNLNLHVLPKWRDRDFTMLRRADVIELVEGILSTASRFWPTGCRASFPWFSVSRLIAI